MTTDLEGIVLKVKDHKEKDGIVWLMTKDRIYTVRSRGIMNSTSKLRSCCQPFSHVFWTISEKNRGFPLLLQGNCTEFYYNIQKDLRIQALSFVLRDILIRTDINEHLFNIALSYFRLVHKNDDKLYAWATLLLREALIIEGIQPNTDGCIRCLRKDQIESLSLSQGGFLCHACNQGQKKLTKEELIKIYSLFHVHYQDMGKFCNHFTFSMDDVMYWIHWYEYHDQIHLDSYRFLKEIVKSVKKSDT